MSEYGTTPLMVIIIGDDYRCNTGRDNNSLLPVLVYLSAQTCKHTKFRFENPKNENKNIVQGH